MQKLIIILLLVLCICSCRIQQVTILDGEIIGKKQTFGLKNKQDTIEYITLHDGKVITILEFNKKWDETVSKTTNRLKKNN